MNNRPLAQATLITGDPPTLSQIDVLFSNAIQAILGIFGIVLFIWLLLGGFKYIMSSGDPSKAEDAKKTLTYAIYGMVFVAMAYLLLSILAAITGVDALRTFTIFQ